MEKIKKISKKEVIFLIFLYLVMLYLWTLPFQNNPIPYGEPDAAIHFRLADDIFIRDKALTSVPEANPVLGFNQTKYPNYAPPFHSNLGISEIIGGSRIIPFYLYLALTSSFIFFSVYFLIRRLYGQAAAFLVSFLIIFSMRDRLTYLWGQWSTGIALIFLPLVLYLLYKYTDHYLKKEPKPIYLFMFGIIFAIQFLFHPAIFFLTLAMVMVYLVLIIIKERKIPFNFKHLFLGIILVLVVITLFAPLQMPNYYKRIGLALGFERFKGEVGTVSGEVPLKENYQTSPFQRIFKWYDFPQEITGSYPAFLFSYKDIYYGYWTLPFLIMGLLFLLLKRRRKDLLILSMVLGFYAITHTDIIGMYLDPKVVRLFYAESIIFYSIIAIGITSIHSFIKMNEKYKKILKYGLITLAVILVLTFNAKPTYDHFKTAYAGPQRLNPAQFEAAEWINENLPEDAAILYAGIPTFPQRAWFQSVSSRLGIFDQPNIVPILDPNLKKTNHILIDYSFYYIYNQQDSIKQLQAWEVQNTNNTKLIYNQNYVKVYKIEN